MGVPAVTFSSQGDLRQQMTDEYGLMPFDLATPSRAPWFTPSAVEHGRVFSIPWNEKTLCGTVIIDDQTQTVYITTGHG